MRNLCSLPATCGRIAATALLSGCGGGGDIGPPTTPAAITVASGNAQTGVAGGALAQPVTAKVTSANGSGLEGITVNFVAAANSGTVSTATAVSNGDGLASVTWTLGAAVGASRDTLRASVSGVSDPAVFTATVTPAAPATLASVSGDAQNGIPGQVLFQPLVVAARDQFANPTPNVRVTWTVTRGTGTLSSTTTITGIDGQASVSWTLGGAGANTVQASAAGLTGSPVSFTASVAAPESELSVGDGNNQTGAPGEVLAQPVIALLKTQAGAPVGGIAVSWAVTAGGGSVSAPSVPTDAQGRASVSWTLGTGAGPQSLSATVNGARGSPLTFGAVATTPSATVILTAASPTPIVEGQSATITGSGFSSTAGNNVVTIGGTAANVTAASGTSLTVSVPPFNCQPARDVPIQVRVGSEASNVITQVLNPPSFTTVAVGQQIVLPDPASFCVQLPASSSPEDYLIGVQSTSEVVTSLTPASLTAVVANGLTASAPLTERAPLSSRRTVRLSVKHAEQLWEKHLAREASIRTWERNHFGAMKRLSRWSHSRQGTAAVMPIPPDLQVGDVVPLRIANFTGDPCAQFASIDAVVRTIGTKGVWLEDVTNPIGGYGLAEFQQLSDLFDATIYATDVDYFGVPTDVDRNSRIAVVITNQVNRIGSLLGFVFSGDLFDRVSCSSSNEGEIFYGAAPDPSGTYALGTYSLAEALSDAPYVIAHEFTHIIQNSRRLANNAPSLLTVWEGEGQAVLAQEVVGHAFEEKTTGQNYGPAIAFNEDDPISIDWYSFGFSMLAGYYGFNGTSEKVPHAPEECSWLDNSDDNESPCEVGALPYGAPWALLRWLSDHFGPGFPGGEKGLHQAFINNPGTGYANIASVVGVPIRTLLSEWAAMLYADDRTPGLAARLTLPSWNLLEIYEGDATLEAARLVPRVREFRNFTDVFNVRAGSSAYFRVSGTSRSATAIRVRNNADGRLPSIMQVFVVRLQ